MFGGGIPCFFDQRGYISVEKADVHIVHYTRPLEVVH